LKIRVIEEIIDRKYGGVLDGKGCVDGIAKNIFDPVGIRILVFGKILLSVETTLSQTSSFSSSNSSSSSPGVSSRRLMPIGYLRSRGLMYTQSLMRDFGILAMRSSAKSPWGSITATPLPFSISPLAIW